MNIFSRLTNSLLQVQTDVVRLICALLPWLVPLVPAYITFSHALNEMGYALWISIVMGVVVEGLGLASLVIFFQFWSHNRKYTSTENRMPLWIPIFTYVFYLTVVLSINVILDYVAGEQITKIWVVALFSTLSIPAGMLLSVQVVHIEWSTNHNLMLAERKQAKREQRESKIEPIAVISAETVNSAHEIEQEYHASDYVEQILSMLERKYALTGQIATPKEISEQLGINPRTNSGYISTLTKKWKAENGLSDVPTPRVSRENSK